MLVYLDARISRCSYISIVVYLNRKCWYIYMRVYLDAGIPTWHLNPLHEIADGTILFNTNIFHSTQTSSLVYLNAISKEYNPPLNLHILYRYTYTEAYPFIGRGLQHIYIYHIPLPCTYTV